MLHKNNPYDAYDDINQTRQKEFLNNPELFAKKAKYFTRKYAGPTIYNKILPNISNGWDFTYNE